MTRASLVWFPITAFASLWLTALAMYDRSPTPTAHLVLLCIIGAFITGHELGRRRRP